MPMSRQVPPVDADPDGTYDSRYIKRNVAAVVVADLSAAVIANFASASALATEVTNRTTADTTIVNSVTSETVFRTSADTAHAALTTTHGATGVIVGTTNTQTLTNKTLTTPTIASLTNAQHDHSNAAGGGNIPQSSVTSLTTDIAARVLTTTYNGHTGSTASHGASGAVVGTINTQTLTNKTINGPDNTLTNIAQSSVTNLTTDLAARATTSALTAHTGASTGVHGVTGAVVGTTDTQTLSAKTLTTPTIASFTNAQHDHSNAAGGGQISFANLTNKPFPPLVGGGTRYITVLTHGCYASTTGTLALTANTGYFVPLDIEFDSVSVASIQYEIVTVAGTGIKAALYDSTGTNRLPGNFLKGGLNSSLAIGVTENAFVAQAIGATTLPTRFYVAIVADGAVTLRTVATAVRSMFLGSGLTDLNRKGMLTAPVTYATGFVTTPSYTYTEANNALFVGLRCL